MAWQISASDKAMQYFHFDKMNLDYSLGTFNMKLTYQDILLNNILYFINVKSSILGVSRVHIAKEIFQLFCSDQSDEEKRLNLSKLDRAQSEGDCSEIAGVFAVSLKHFQA